MKSLMVGFSRPKKWKLMPWIIMKLYGTSYAHVYVKFYSNSYDRNLIYQASSVMINFMGTKIFDDANVVYREFLVEVTDENYSKLMQFAIDNAGKPYSIKEAIGLGIIQIVSWFGKKIANPFKDGTEGYVCSVLASYILEQYTDLDPEGDAENVSPKDLYEFFKNRVDA